MAHIDPRKKKIQGKIVYYGPGLCGKTTNLEYVSKQVAGSQSMMSLSTEGDRTIFFDFFPLDLGKIRGMETAFKLYTVPGQVRYNQTRKMVLKNVDGVVFVADSQAQMMDANLESLENLFNNLDELGIDHDDVALILQYNKRDLPGVLSTKELDKILNQSGRPTFEASAFTGEGVVDTLKGVCKEVLRNLDGMLSGAASTKSKKAKIKSQLSPINKLPPPKRPPSPATKPPLPATKPSSPEVSNANEGSGEQMLLSFSEFMTRQIKAQAAMDQKLDALARDTGRLAGKIDNLSNGRAQGGSDHASSQIQSALNEDISRLGETVEELRKSLSAKGSTKGAAMAEDMEALGRRVGVLAQRLKEPPKINIDKKMLMEGLGDVAGRKDLEALKQSIGKLGENLAAGGHGGGATSDGSDTKVAEQLTKLREEQLGKADIESLKAEIARLAKSTATAAATSSGPQLDGVLDELKKVVAQEMGSVRAFVQEAVATLTGELVALRQSAGVAGAAAPAVSQAAAETPAEAATQPAANKVPAATPENPQAAEAKTEAKPSDAKVPDDKPAEAKTKEKAVESKAGKPAAAKADDKPAESKAEGKPAAAKADDKPAEAKAKPAETKSAEAKSAEAEGKPAETKSAEAKAEDKSAEAKAPEATGNGKSTPSEEELAKDPEYKNASRIARVMVADLYLYYKENVEEGIKNDDFLERNKEALEEIKTTFESRVTEEVRAKHDYMGKALGAFIEKKRKDLGL